MGRFPTANKSFGQHFLTSPKVISKITSPLPTGVDAIIEVGPGPAVLTPHLASYKLPYYVIEMDERFVEILSPIVGPDKIFRQDALEFDWKGFLALKDFKNIWLVSNLPYNISVPLTLKFMQTPEITQMTLMYQKEVAEKILPKDLRNAMGSLHVLCTSQFDVSHVVYAPPGAFSPPPKVESQVLHFKRKETPLIPLSKLLEFEKFLRLVFAQKRKQLGGILKKEWGVPKTESCLKTVGLDPQVRSEALKIEQVLQLYDCSMKYLEDSI
ncbi:MAG TPA: 16S rRNA (adenine(1518)-N(6)/adenine(1519)-N(6))-dimethyltransferase RsmA [Bacteriovoracaceae bacterium]|nr:16S rRNA (adenine(1518)-N(6)/adenine(1519)-N(6))-dimethyltransferase RsmA [Bacteriovoracaceae bacterium]